MRLGLVAVGIAAAIIVTAAEVPALSPSQKLVFENADVRVSEATIAPGQAEPEHYHLRGVTVALTAYDNQVTALPQRTVTNRKTKFGEVRWAEPAHHETRNTGTTPQHVIRVELKNPTPASPSQLDALDSVMVAKDTQRVLFENADVRVVEEKTPPGVVQPKHRHRKSVLIPLADSELEIADVPSGDANTPLGPKARRQIKFGNAVWNNPSLHEAANVGKTEALNIRIEIK